MARSYEPGEAIRPDEGLTKLDLAQCYARIAGQILPWLKGRAVIMERCPEGIRASCFYQKRAPLNLPGEVPTVTLPATSPGSDIDYIVGGTRKTLLMLVNLGCVEMHVMNWRVYEVDKPDWLTLDLDPADGFSSAARVALLLRTKLEDHGLEAFVNLRRTRSAHLRSASPGCRPGSRSCLRSGHRRRDGARVSATRDARSAKGETPRSRVRRHHAKRTGAEHRAAILGSLASESPGLDAARLGRGQPASGPGRFQHQDRRAADAGQVAVVELLRPSSDAASSGRLDDRVSTG